MTAMTLEKFRTLKTRDFGNGAVLDEIEQALGELEEAQKAIRAALIIESLWMPPDDQNDPEYDEEYEALAMMREAFRSVYGRR